MYTMFEQGQQASQVQTVQINAALLATLPVDSEVLPSALEQVPSISTMLREAQEREAYLDA